MYEHTAAFIILDQQSFNSIRYVILSVERTFYETIINTINIYRIIRFICQFPTNSTSSKRYMHVYNQNLDNKTVTQTKPFEEATIDNYLMSFLFTNARN